MRRPDAELKERLAFIEQECQSVPYWQAAESALPLLTIGAAACSQGFLLLQ
jgi:hypothetical protein